MLTLVALKAVLGCDGDAEGQKTALFNLYNALPTLWKLTADWELGGHKKSSKASASLQSGPMTATMDHCRASIIAKVTIDYLCDEDSTAVLQRLHFLKRDARKELESKTAVLEATWRALDEGRTAELPEMAATEACKARGRSPNDGLQLILERARRQMMLNPRAKRSDRISMYRMERQREQSESLQK